MAAAFATAMPHAQAELVTNTARFKHPVISAEFGLKPPSIQQPYGYHIDFTYKNDPGDAPPLKNFSGGYGFGSNGHWDSSISMTGLNSANGYMDFTFLNGPVAGAGGFLNYVPETLGEMEITALGRDKDNQEVLLETHKLTFITGGGTNSGAEFYIIRDKAEIKTLRLSKAYVGITNFTYDRPVPGPLPLLAVAAAFGSSRKIRRRIAGQTKRDSTPNA